MPSAVVSPELAKGQWLLSAQMVSILDKEGLPIACSTSCGEDGADAVQPRLGNTLSPPVHNPNSATPDPHIPDRHVELSPSAGNCAQEETSQWLACNEFRHRKVFSSPLLIKNLRDLTLRSKGRTLKGLFFFMPKSIPHRQFSCNHPGLEAERIYQDDFQADITSRGPSSACLILEHRWSQNVLLYSHFQEPWPCKGKKQRMSFSVQQSFYYNIF